MRCAPPLPNKQSKEFQLASAICVGIYGKRFGRQFRTKHETRISAAKLRLKNLPDTARRFLGRRAIHLAAEILDSFEWKSNPSTPGLRLNLRLILWLKERAFDRFLTWHTASDTFDWFEYFPHSWPARGSSLSTCLNQKSHCVRKRRREHTKFYCNLYRTLRRYYLGTRHMRRNDVVPLSLLSLIRIAFASWDKNAVHHALLCISFWINSTSFLERWRGPCVVQLIVVVAVARVGITESSLVSPTTIKTTVVQFSSKKWQPV